MKKPQTADATDALTLDRYRLLSQHARDILLFVRRDGRILEANYAATAAYGYTRDELLALSIADLSAPESLPALAAQLATADREGIIFETVHRRRDGSTFPVEVSARGDVVAGERLVLSVIRDISERKRAEQALRESEERFRFLAETVPSIVWTAGPDGTITYANRRWWEYCGLTPEQNARGWPELVLHPDDYQRCVTQWGEALREGKRYEIEVRNRRHDGVYRWFITRAAPRKDAAGRVVAWFGVTTDIHDQKLLQDELRESDRRKDEFLATLAHELRNPLAPIRNSLEILNLTDGDGRALARARETLERQVGHLVRLVDDLLDVSRITRGKIRLQPEPLDLVAVVETAVETSRPLIEARGHALKVTLPDGPVVAKGDAMRLAQVVANLLNNAAKYTAPGGRIRVRLERRKLAAVIRVSDTGIGIPKAMLTKVFDMFTQLEGPPDRAQGGLGLGLTLVKSFVEMHGGTVEAHSAGPGKGSEFIVRLPAPGN